MLRATHRVLNWCIVLTIFATLVFPFQSKAETNQPPIITSTPPTATITAGASVNYQALATDPEGNPVTFSFHASQSGMAITPAGNFSWTPKQAGTFSATIAATDTFGNSAAQTLAFTVVPAAPATLTVTPQQSSRNAGENIAYSVKAADIYGNTTEITSATIMTVPQAAGGKTQGTTYTTQYSGSWQLDFSYQSLHATAALSVSPGQATSLTASPSATEVTAGEELPFQTTLHDTYGNSWDATDATVVTSNEPKATIHGTTYQAKKKGAWKVTTSVASISTAADVQVQSGNPEFISIDPNEPLMSLKVGQTKQFSIHVSDIYGNDITDLPISWDITPNLGTITADGLLAAKKAGSATLIAMAGSLSAKEQLAIIPETGAAQTTNATSNANNGVVKGESVENSQQEIASPTKEQEDTTTGAKCQSPRLWLAILIYVLYMVALSGYFFAIKRESDRTWWIFPILLTAIGVIIYIKYFCSAYMWWPWILVLLGIVTTGLMKRKMHPPIPPQNQQPLF